MPRVDWSGVFAVSVTPFSETGEFDEPAIRQLIGLLIDEGVDGIVLAGSTGEWFTLTDEERVALFRIAKEVAGDRTRLLAGISAISTDSAVHLASEAKALDLEGALLLPPPYIMPTDRELEAYVAAVAEVGLPIMLYNNPPRTGVNLDGRWLGRFLQHDAVVAIKESSKDIHQLSATIRDFGSELAVFTGMETYLSPTLLRGGAGVVAMAPNVLGEVAIDLYRAVRDGDLAKARGLQETVDRLYGYMYSGKSNPYVVLKEGMRILGRPGGYPRRPLMPLADDERAALTEFLKATG